MSLLEALQVPYTACLSEQSSYPHCQVGGRPMPFRRTNYCLLLLSSLCFIYAVSAFAEDTIRATVSVTKGSTPVSNLTQADFNVKDSGKTRGVTEFTAPTL